MLHQIVQKRNGFKPQSTLSELFVPIAPLSRRFCYILEDTVRANGVKVWGKTAIPFTENRPYKVGTRIWAKHNKPCLVLYDYIIQENGVEVYVIERYGQKWTQVMVHGGNDVDDTDACPLAGYSAIQNEPEFRIAQRASDDLYQLLKPLMDAGDTVEWAIEKV